MRRLIRDPEDPARELENLENKAIKNVLDKIDAAAKEGAPLNELTEALKIVKNTITNPTNENLDSCHNRARELSKRKWGKAIAGALLALLGVVTIGLAVGLAVATYGGAIPIAIPAVKLGIGLIAVGLGLGTVLGSVLGGFAASHGIQFFDDLKRDDKKRQVGKGMSDLVDDLRKKGPRNS